MQQRPMILQVEVMPLRKLKFRNKELNNVVNYYLSTWLVVRELKIA